MYLKGFLIIIVLFSLLVLLIFSFVAGVFLSQGRKTPLQRNIRVLI